ncbi:phytoene/squalene synthase family protein [Cellulophaga omnivescoria]|uniref:phytoene/squalene synthase family protein n=1 Tax=Cellulophaga omnivescoria TaxID=1888890 RepID=UPI00098606D7|nr:phytoene/squalene synthase family protein [Cellulophaga omnivescoria]WBU89863.1 phytoene/squalene synthase family protein [Cellulophaga omnivescoria]
MKALFDSSSVNCSKLITTTYSTSFSIGIKLFAPSIRPAIYAIYGFVRYADEIVDTFHDYDQEILLNEFEEEYRKSLVRKISLNPIINSFQEVVLKYELQEYVDAFLTSMRFDLNKTEYSTREEYKEYIYGSADVVGLMCLRVFVNNDNERFNHLKESAQYLGSAFQKVNFLRDFKDDINELGRSYFPELNTNTLTHTAKDRILQDIENDFAEAYKGIVQLPLESRLGVFVAYKYYSKLLNKLKKADTSSIMNSRIRISNPLKFLILTKAYIRFKFNII